jgi:hypothetical protein
MPVHGDYDYFIVNYEYLSKIKDLANILSKSPDSVGVIVDESHNFLRVE